MIDASTTVLPRAEWAPLAETHAERADALTAGHRERAGRGERHAIEDFLYDYYPTRPAQLRRWHPGVGVALQDAPDHAGWRYYATADGATGVDVAAFWESRGATVDYVEELLTATAGRPAMRGCFGLHEWAMVYRAGGNRRHALPLRLGQGGTDAVVESHDLACTHLDAFRFFTPEAAPRNALQLTRADQPRHEQPGCLHANMDLYKWCLKLTPALPSDLTMDAFELALEIRYVDMRASPYDVSAYGLEPIAVETRDGKREYAELQCDFATRGANLRARIVASVNDAREWHARTVGETRRHPGAGVIPALAAASTAAATTLTTSGWKTLGMM